MMDTSQKLLAEILVRHAPFSSLDELCKCRRCGLLFARAVARGRYRSVCIPYCPDCGYASGAIDRRCRYQELEEE